MKTRNKHKKIVKTVKFCGNLLKFARKFVVKIRWFFSGAFSEISVLAKNKFAKLKSKLGVALPIF